MNKLFFFLFSLLPLTAFSQTSPEEQKLLAFVKNIAVFNRLYPQEKVYLHFDNSAYFLGETMWFKAYLATADSLRPSPFSKVVYIELLSPEGYVVETKKLKAENGQCHGDFALRDSLHAGYYEVRAYSRAMLNFGEETVFSRVFPVFNRPTQAGVYEKKMTLRNPRRSIPDLRAEAPKMKKLDLQFFPEGGNLIQDLPCVVALKATGEQGQGVAVNGKIYNSKNEEIADIETIHRGMGFFSFLPDGQSYKAKVQYEGKEYTFDLPKSLPAGYVLNVQNLRQDEVGIRILKTRDLPDQPLGITLTCRGKLQFFEAFSLDDFDEYALQFPKADLPAGVNQITLFDAKGEILAERLFFVPAKEEEKVKIEPRLRNRLEPYGLINLDFEAKDPAGQPVATVFSLAIRDAATAIPTASTATMQSYFLLASDLKGYIEDPDYYFETDDNRHRLALDLLMMTQGWRRYEWQTLAGAKPFEVKYPMEESMIADGRILSLAKNKPVPDVEVTMWAYSPEGTSKQGKCMTDPAGRFNFDLGDIYGEWDMNLQVKKNKKSQACSILLDRAFRPQAKAFLPVEMELPEWKNELLKPVEVMEDTVDNQLSDELPDDMQTRTHPLPELVVSATKLFLMKSQGLAYADVVYDVGKVADDLMDRNKDVDIDILDFIVQNNKYFTYYDEYIDMGGELIIIAHCFYKGNVALFVVDNRLYEDSFQDLQELIDKKGITHFSQISKRPDPDLYQGNIRDFIVNEIESVMVSEDRAAAMKYCPDCNPTRDYATLFLYTKIHDKRKTQAGIRETKFQGYSTVREFYHPQYDNNYLPKEKEVRRTLYWNPDVQTDAAGIATIQFYNNAVCTDLSVDMEGFAKL